MIPASYLTKWADTQAEYMAQLRLEAWMRKELGISNEWENAI